MLGHNKHPARPGHATANVWRQHPPRICDADTTIFVPGRSDPYRTPRKLAPSSTPTRTSRCTAPRPRSRHAASPRTAPARSTQSSTVRSSRRTCPRPAGGPAQARVRRPGRLACLRDDRVHAEGRDLRRQSKLARPGHQHRPVHRFHTPQGDLHVHPHPRPKAGHLGRLHH